ncbi:hypothetical protein PoB_002185000 [Plakobranchus ocellatus]|uniref:Uncharacterized protein n=1 Tax=Plakobranchus ocellatus TaxID=259542 RepID=A0AAV3ZI79_9GAST|nr:hypothetical protein PoB_002185000 [Plakobranchus ocellatus]
MSWDFRLLFFRFLYLHDTFLLLHLHYQERSGSDGGSGGGWSDSVSHGDGGDGSGDGNGNFGGSGDANEGYSGDYIANGDGSCGDGGGNGRSDGDGVLMAVAVVMVVMLVMIAAIALSMVLEVVVQKASLMMVPTVGGTVNRKSASDLKGVFCHEFELHQRCSGLIEDLQTSDHLDEENTNQARINLSASKSSYPWQQCIE